MTYQLCLYLYVSEVERERGIGRNITAPAQRRSILRHSRTRHPNVPGSCDAHDHPASIASSPYSSQSRSPIYSAQSKLPRHTKRNVRGKLPAFYFWFAYLYLDLYMDLRILNLLGVTCKKYNNVRRLDAELTCVWMSGSRRLLPGASMSEKRKGTGTYKESKGLRNDILFRYYA
ncbi:hypothetical protein KQX54_017389 [Cotesia glomerata]|uniref:Uncharacterized protein n=1 Tax=Cotesia glomerata TaxID=32391 RepID=A0AAV7HY25_COTGL|nr:hypothetical protein KQX54_017389 [Cotesia glomerata]